MTNPPKSPITTKRELQVLFLIGCGMTQAQVAESLMVPLETVKSRLKNARGRYQLTALTGDWLSPAILRTMVDQGYLTWPGPIKPYKANWGRPEE